MKKQKYIYYCGNYDRLSSKSLILEKGYRLEVWSPKIHRLTPKNLFFKPIIVWWLFYYFKIFKSCDYKIFIIYFGNKEIAHYSVVLPKHFKTPFMEKNDLQIGPIGTNENHRRKGLASYAINRILEFYKEKKCNFWYITREENEASRKFVEGAGFTKYGEGTKIKKIGFGLFDTFVLEKKY
jgi:ribosomal protein S18 acetylase RimI-like enzyme